MAVSRLTQTTLQNGFEKYNQLWDGRSAVGSMEAISAITLSAAQSSVEFNNIPGTYSHLQLRFFVRTNRSTYNVDELYIYCNNDTTASNYAGHYLVANNNNFPGTVSAGGAANFVTPYYVGANNGNAPFAAWIVDFVDYANTNKNKTIRGLGGADSNGDVSGFCTVPMLNSSLWKNTAAVTSIRIVPGLGTAFNANSSFSLYGIK